MKKLLLVLCLLLVPIHFSAQENGSKKNQPSVKADGLNDEDLKLENETRKYIGANRAEITEDMWFYSLVKSAIRIHFKGKQPKQKAILYGSLKGMVRSLGDPYSYFMTPEEKALFDNQIGSGEFGGIGANIKYEYDYVVVVNVKPGSPADAAHILEGDKITEIGGTSVADMSLDEATAKIRGPIGSTIKISLLRDGSDSPEDISLKRVKMETEERASMGWKKIGNVAVITLPEFSEYAEKDFKRIVSEIVLNEEIEFIVVDVRDNPGGFSSVCANILSFWSADAQTPFMIKEGLDKTSAIRLQDEIGTLALLNGQDKRGILKKYKTVVLVNGESASAAEVFSGFMQDYKLATVIGEKTFGKGSAQANFDFRDRSALHLTVALWRTPISKRSFNGNGLVPNVSVKMTVEDERLKKDPQLDRALEFLRTGK